MTPTTHPTTPPAELSVWIADGDTIPAELIDITRNAICREFGNNGTDGYYKRILVKIFAALAARELPAASLGENEAAKELTHEELTSEAWRVTVNLRKTGHYLAASLMQELARRVPTPSTAGSVWTQAQVDEAERQGAALYAKFNPPPKPEAGEVVARARQIIADWHRKKGCGQQVVDDCVSGSIEIPAIYMEMLITALTAKPEGDGGEVRGYWIVEKKSGHTRIYNAESGDSCEVECGDESPQAEILRQLADDAKEWGRPRSFITGGKMVDGVWVITAQPASDLLPEQMLVRYDDYKAATTQARP